MTKNQSILIVEDSAVQAALLKKLFQGAGYHVVAAANGADALTKLEADLPSVIVSDIDMPEMDGYQFCRAVKSGSRTKEIPVVLLTSLSDPHNVVLGLQAGADNYVTKPYDGSRLLARVESLRKSPSLYRSPLDGEALDFHLGGRDFSIQSSRGQILNLLLSTFEGAVWQNQQLREANEELQLMHREMQQKNRELAEAIETQNRFLGMAAHDMRNPLAVVMGYAKVMMHGLSGTLNPKQEKMTQAIHRSTQTLLQLVNELLEISELESGQLVLDLKEEELLPVVRQVVELNGFLAENKGIKIAEELKPVPTIQLDIPKFEQVLNNLLTNAVKFSHRDTVVTVRVWADDKEVHLSVADQGQGIPAEEQATLFQPFQKTSVKGTEGEKSTGLGLAIVKRIVDGHGARIEVSSEPGEGSEFSIHFPIS